MNKKMAVAMLPLIILSTMSPAMAASPPHFSPKTITEVDYKGYDAVQHKWTGLYNSDVYTVRVFSKNRRLLGWEITKELPGNVSKIVSERDFVSDEETNPPLCGFKVVSFVDYQGHTITKNSWTCVYDNDLYVLNVYSKSHYLLGWQIFKNGQLTSIRSFV